jgi:hypothetical protein
MRVKTTRADSPKEAFPDVAAQQENIQNKIESRINNILLNCGTKAAPKQNET